MIYFVASIALAALGVIHFHMGLIGLAIICGSLSSAMLSLCLATAQKDFNQAMIESFKVLNSAVREEIKNRKDGIK